MKNKSILITGTSGFIGKHLSKYLASLGNNIYGIGHGIWSEHERLNHGVTEWLNADIQGNSLQIIKKSAKSIDYIYHLAGGSSVGLSLQNPYEDFFRTVVTTEEILEWVRQESPETKLIVISSAAVYGSEHNDRIRENTPLHPFSPYGYHKMMMESLCQSYGENYGIASIIVRLFSVYGAGLHKQLLWDICSRLFRQESVIKLHGTGDELRDWIEIRDVVRLLEKSSELAGSHVPIINGGSGKATSIKRIAEIILDSWGTTLPIEFTGNVRTGDPVNLVSMPTTINDESFNWEIDIHAGIANYTKWFKESIS